MKKICSSPLFPGFLLAIISLAFVPIIHWHGEARKHRFEIESDLQALANQSYGRKKYASAQACWSRQVEGFTSKGERVTISLYKKDGNIVSQPTLAAK